MFGEAHSLALARASTQFPGWSDAGPGSPQTLTFYRRWTWSEDGPEGGVPGAVPGLCGALNDAGLGDCQEQAEKWCLQMGAAFISEVAEQFEDFCTALEASRSAQICTDQRDQLHAALLVYSKEDC